MITITINHDAKKKLLSVDAKGHANYAEHGKDIVCASVSVLMYTLYGSLSRLGEEWRAKYSKKSSLGTLYELKASLREGDAHIECYCKYASMFKDALKTLSVIEGGLTLVAESYPRYVEFINDVEDD